jgi:hypothetical protein
MMSMAQGDEVFRVRPPPVLPVPDVMAMEPAAAVAARDPAASVALLDHHPGAIRHGAEGTAHADRPPAGLDHRPDAGVAADEAADSLGQPRPEVQVPVGVAVGVGAHVEKHQVALVMRTGRPCEGPVGHGDEGVGPVDVGRSRHRCLLVLAGPEPLVASRQQGPLDQRSFIGGQHGRQPPGAPLGRAETHLPGLGRRLGLPGLGGIGLGLLDEGVAAQHPPQLHHRGGPGQARDLLVGPAGGVRAHHRHLVLAQLTRLEGGPGLGQFRQPPGNEHQDAGPRRRHAALPGQPL